MNTQKYDLEEYIKCPLLTNVGGYISRRWPTIVPSIPTDKKKQQFITLIAVLFTSYLLVAWTIGIINGDIAPPKAINKIMKTINFVLISKSKNRDIIAKKHEVIMQTVFIKITRLLLKKLLIEAKDSPAIPATTIIKDKMAEAFVADKLI